jgi:hypothetical protein
MMGFSALMTCASVTVSVGGEGCEVATIIDSTITHIAKEAWICKIEDLHDCTSA